MQVYVKANTDQPSGRLGSHDFYLFRFFSDATQKVKQIVIIHTEQASCRYLVTNFPKKKQKTTQSRDIIKKGLWNDLPPKECMGISSVAMPSLTYQWTLMKLGGALSK